MQSPGVLDPARAPSPAAQHEEAAAAQRLIHELAAGDRDRQALLRFYVAGDARERICAELGVEAASFDRLVARARQRFKEMLHAEHGEEEHEHPGLDDSLRRGLTRFAARVAAGEAPAGEGLVPRLHSPWSTALLLALLVAALAAAGVLELRVLRLQRAEQARATAPRPVPPPSAQLEAELRAARRALDEERVRAGERLERERRQREVLAEDLERARQPHINTPVVELARDHAGTVSRLSPARPGWIVVLLPLAAPGDAPSYRAALLGAHGDTLWKSGGLRPDAAGSLVISLPSALLKPGSYQIDVVSSPWKDPPAAVGSYAFRVAR